MRAADSELTRGALRSFSGSGRMRGRREVLHRGEMDLTRVSASRGIVTWQQWALYGGTYCITFTISLESGILPGTVGFEDVPDIQRTQIRYLDVQPWVCGQCRKADVISISLAAYEEQLHVASVVLYFFYLDSLCKYYKFNTVSGTAPFGILYANYLCLTTLRVYYEFYIVRRLLHSESTYICSNSRYFLVDSESFCIYCRSFSSFTPPFCVQCKTEWMQHPLFSAVYAELWTS